MLLVEVWNDIARPGDPDFRIAQGFQAFTYAWDQGLISISKISYTISKKHGGLIKPSFGTMTLSPDVATNELISINVYYTNNDDTDMQLLFSGTGFTNNRTAVAAVYDIFTDTPNVKIESDLDYTSSHTLVTVFQAYCTSAGWTLNSTLARATDINVNFTASAGQLFATMLSEMCETYSHYFLIDVENETIHLRDMETGAGTTVTVTEFEIFPSKYAYAIPPAKISIDTGSSSTEVVYGAPYYFGPQIELKSFHDTDSTLNGDLAQRVKDIYNEGIYKFELHMPTEYMVDLGINFLTKNVLTWEDTTIDFPDGDSTITMVMQELSFDTSGEAILSGYTTLVA